MMNRQKGTEETRLLGVGSADVMAVGLKWHLNAAAITLTNGLING